MIFWLIEGLYRSSPVVWSFRCYFHIFGSSFSEGKKCSRKNQLVQELIPPPSIRIHVSTLYIYTNTYMPTFSPYGFFGLSKRLVPTPELTSEYPTFSMCARQKKTPRTLPPSSKNLKSETQSFLMSKITSHASNKCPV